MGTKKAPRNSRGFLNKTGVLLFSHQLIESEGYIIHCTNHWVTIVSSVVFV